LLVQGKDSNAALPLHPHPAPVYHDGKIQALSNWQLAGKTKKNRLLAFG
jgi:hypothetical protein